MFFRRRHLWAAGAGEDVARILMLLLRWISIFAGCVMAIGLLFNFSITMITRQFLPEIGLLLALNAMFSGMYLFARNWRRACEREAETHPKIPSP